MSGDVPVTNPTPSTSPDETAGAPSIPVEMITVDASVIVTTEPEYLPDPPEITF